MGNLKQIIEDSFTQYAGAVLQSRALVDVRDCIKPSARQIYYCLETDGFTHNKPFKKTLKGIGSAMRLYIHGDSSCEGVIMRSAQPFAMRYPLVEVEGSFGTQTEGGNWAAPRYTASRLSSLAAEFFKDIDKKTIFEWRDNYDDTEKYPAVLPSKGFYNIVNGTFGIGIGASSSIPSFNLAEVNNALVKLLNNPEIDFEEIYCVPDFATGGLLINADEVKEALRNGTGKACMLRAKIIYDIKDNCLIATEIPYSVYTNTICKELEGILDSEDNPGIDRFNDLTGETSIIKIYLKADAIPERVIRYLYKNTSLQYFYGINLTMLDNGRFPKLFTWKEALQAYLEHEKQVYQQAFIFDLNKIKERLHIIEGLLKAVDILDDVIALIRSAADTKNATIGLQTQFGFTEAQAKAILDIKLARLANLEIKKLINEKEDLDKEKVRIEEILKNENLLKKEIEKDLIRVAKTYGDERRTVVMNISTEEADDESIPPEDCVVTMMEDGTLKRIPSASFKVQKRGGKGVKNQSEIVSSIIRTNTIDSLLVFSSIGKMYRLPVTSIPEGDNNSTGISIRSLVSIAADEKPSVIYSMYKDNSLHYVLFVTKDGMIKRTPLAEYIKTKKTTGINAINLRDSELASVSLIENEEILIITKKGQVIRINSTDLPISSRISIGVIGIKLNEDDEVVCALPIRDKTDELAIFNEEGVGKKTNLKEFPVQGRGGKGVCGMKTDRPVITAALVSNEDKVLISGTASSICISASEIPSLGRSTVGNILLSKGKVKAVTKI